MKTLSKPIRLLQEGKLMQISFAFIIITMTSDPMNRDGRIHGVSALRVRGEFDLSDDFFVFLAKFGFQKTEVRDPNNTQGVIYGNITLLHKIAEDTQISTNRNATKEYNSSQSYCKI